MSWGAVFGIGGESISLGIFGGIVGANFWFWFRRRHSVWGAPVTSTIAGVVLVFAVIGVIVWIAKVLV